MLTNMVFLNLLIWGQLNNPREVSQRRQVEQTDKQKRVQEHLW